MAADWSLRAFLDWVDSEPSWRLGFSESLHGSSARGRIGDCATESASATSRAAAGAYVQRRAPRVVNDLNRLQTLGRGENETAREIPNGRSRQPRRSSVFGEIDLECV